MPREQKYETIIRQNLVSGPHDKAVNWGMREEKVLCARFFVLLLRLNKFEYAKLQAQKFMQHSYMYLANGFSFAAYTQNLQFL